MLWFRVTALLRLEVAEMMFDSSRGADWSPEEDVGAAAANAALALVSGLPGAAAAKAGQPCYPCPWYSAYSATLTNQIKAATTIEALLFMHRVHERNLNRIHLSAFWNSLGKLATQQPA